MAVAAPESDDPWMRCMRRGEFEAAWRISDAVLRERAGQPCWHWPRHQQYIWDGAPLDGKRVLVRCYHGLGDTIQFIRYAPLLRRVAREVVVWAQPSLLPLLESVEGIGQLLPLHDGAPDVDYDADVELMELPYLFRTTLATLPTAVPYLRIEHAAREGAVRPRIGVVWRAGEWNDTRSVPAALMARLSDVMEAEIVVLQDRARATEWPAGCGRLVRPEPVSELAREIAGLDLLISVDTLAAHLGGALAVPTWTLLPARADWRWMEGREDSPWYPTMRLWRQQRAGEWEPVIDEMRRVLGAFTFARPSAR